jgi:hypothetical protein
VDNNILIIILTILSTIIVVVAAPMIVSFLKSRQVPTEDILNNIDELASIVKSMNNPRNKDIKVLDLIVSSAEQAVKYSEQIYISGQISEGQRKEKAVQFVRTVLYDANIDITPDRETLINSAIEAAVFLLPKTTRH